MTAAGSRKQGAGTVLRWGACLAVVLGLHAGTALVLLRRVPRPEPPPVTLDAVMLELAPAAAPPADPVPPAPEPQPNPEPQPDPAPTPAPPQPEPTPQIVPPAVPLPNPAVTFPEPPPPPKRPPPPRPAVRPQPPRPAPATSPPQVSEAPAPSAAAVPAPAVSAAPSSSAVSGWRSELSGRLQRAKRYPDAARARDEQGSAAVRFTIDRGGHVLSASLVRSSGSPSIDEEAVALVRRADPLPPVPAELVGSTLTLTVPVTFSLR